MQDETTFTYKMILSYKGTKYSGWQAQGKESKTVQHSVEKVLASIAKYKDFQVIGASRTDTGVHAIGQVLKVKLPREVLPSNLLRGMNTKLPSDIRVLECEFASPKLNVNRDSKSKEYHYYFTINKSESAVSGETVYSYPQELNLELMNKACSMLIGKHNFLSFCTPGLITKPPIRNILECSIEKTNFLTFENEVYFLKIIGSGFLKYMVRFLMGALWDIGSNNLTIEDFQKSLEHGEKKGIRTKAPAKGLTLIKINF